MCAGMYFSDKFGGGGFVYIHCLVWHAHQPVAVRLILALPLSASHELSVMQPAVFAVGTATGAEREAALGSPAEGKR